MSKKWPCHFFEKASLCIAPLLSADRADNSTLTSRIVFSATHMSRQKTDFTTFASADAKLCEAFLKKFNSAGTFSRGIRIIHIQNIFTGGVVQ